MSDYLRQNGVSFFIQAVALIFASVAFSGTGRVVFIGAILVIVAATTVGCVAAWRARRWLATRPSPRPLAIDAAEPEDATWLLDPPAEST